jgi:oligopeptide transport system ATP-binding protein
MSANLYSEAALAQPMFSLRGLTKYFQIAGKQTVHALDNIDLDLYTGETLGLVGESGCGKTTLGRTMVRIYEPTSGMVMYKGRDITKMSRKEALQFCKNVQMIFQDPYASLDPRMTVGSIISEGMEIHGVLKPSERRARVEELLDAVGLNAEHASRFPHEFSGGQRQRIGIARALAINPECIVCDEPISALDVSIQSQIVNLIKRLQDAFQLTYVFIAHDLSMVKYVSDRVAVMYLGHLMEIADSETIYRDPLHPYTQALLSAIPIPDPQLEAEKHRIVLEGEVPSVLAQQIGCPFAGRCARVMDRCRLAKPDLAVRDGEGPNAHRVACFAVGG